MASSLDYVQYVASQLAGAGVITYKKLLGDYGLWWGGKLLEIGRASWWERG